MAKSTADKLREARALLAKPNGWTKGAYARDASGETCVIKSDDAVCFCLIGALDRCWVDSGPVRCHMRDILGEGSIVAWNDLQPSVDPVLALLDKVIAHFEAKR